MASPIQNTLTVWHSLFLREVLDRFFGNRIGWAWLIFEPAMQIVIMGSLYSAMRLVGTRDGMDMFLWLAVGMLSFFLFRRVAIQTLHAVDCNRAFFAFRQVRPFDAAIARSGVELFSMFLIDVVIMVGLALFGKDVLPEDPLLILVASIGLWLFGFGYGLVTAVIMRLIPDTSHIVNIMMMPLFFLSGAIMPISTIPLPYRDWLLYNPIVHGVETCRAGFTSLYHGPETSLGYLFIWGFLLLALGAILFRLLETRLVRQ